MLTIIFFQAIFLRLKSHSYSKCGPSTRCFQEKAQSVKSLPALPFNAFIIPILRIVCTISFHYRFKLSSKKNLTDRSKAVLLLLIIYVISVLCLLCFRACLLIGALWSPDGKGLTSWLWSVMSNCKFVTFPLYPGSGVVLGCIKVSNGAKIRNRYNQVPHLTRDTNGKVTNSQKTPQTRAKRSALSQQVTTKHI